MALTLIKALELGIDVGIMTLTLVLNNWCVDCDNAWAIVMALRAPTLTKALALMTPTLVLNNWLLAVACAMPMVFRALE